MPTMTAVVRPDGSVTLTTIDLVEDLWYDYAGFRKQAEIAEKRGETLRTKQHLRACVSSFLYFVPALINRWCAKMLTAAAVPETERGVFLSSKLLCEKHNYLAKQAAIGEFPNECWSALSRTVEDLANLLPDGEERVFESLSLADIVGRQDQILRWCREVGEKLSLSAFHDAAKRGREFAGVLGIHGNEHVPYAGYAELRKDPVAWEKELQERREWEGLGPVVSDDQGS